MKLHRGQPHATRFASLPTIALLLLTLAVGGCRDASQISLTSTVDANQGLATSLDFVWVLDPAAEAQLPADSATWFAQRNALMLHLGDQIAVVSLQVLPLTSIESVAPPDQARRARSLHYYAAFVDASLPSHGTLPTRSTVTLRLGQAGLIVSTDP